MLHHCRQQAQQSQASASTSKAYNLIRIYLCFLCNNTLILILHCFISQQYRYLALLNVMAAAYAMLCTR